MKLSTASHVTIPSAVTAEQEVTANVCNVVAVLGAKDMRILQMSDPWNIIAKMYNCPECGWVTECYPNCPIKEKEYE